jgi:hypothetical protein
VLPGLPSNEKNSYDHYNSYNKGPNLVFFSFTESPSNSLPTIKFPKNHITSSYHSNMPETAKAKIWPIRTLGINNKTFFADRVEKKKNEFWNISTKPKIGILKKLVCLEASTKSHVHKKIHEFLINMAFTMVCLNFKKVLKNSLWSFRG